MRANFGVCCAPAVWELFTILTGRRLVGGAAI